MTKVRGVWIDRERCTRCGACIEACPVGAIALVDDKAHVAEETCTGCGACLEVCPEDAIHPVVEGELVRMQERPVATHRTGGWLAPAVERARPLVESAGPAVAAVGLGLLARAAEALARGVSRWLAEPSVERGTPPVTREGTQAPGSADSRRAGRRHRRRGR